MGRHSLPGIRYPLPLLRLTAEDHPFDTPLFLIHYSLFARSPNEHDHPNCRHHWAS